MDTTRIEDVRVEMVVPLTDSSKAEPGMRDRQRTGIIKLVRMPVMANFTPTLSSTLPYAYAFDATTARAILPILHTHGLSIEQLDDAAHVTAQAFGVDSVMDRGRSETSREMSDVAGRWSSPGARTLPSGTYIVRVGQPLGLLAFYLLEPESEDGLTQWSFLDGIIAAHRDFPILRVTAPATFRTHPVHD